MRAVSFCVLALAALAGCASSPSATGGLPVGKFVTMSCDDKKSFQVRMGEAGRTARVRAHPGSAELDRQADGRYAGEGYVLNLQAEGGAALDHGGKSQGKACKMAK